MTSGLPDYHRTVRPKYGAANNSHLNKVVTANTRTTILSVSGKGIIYGGCMYLDYTSGQRDSIPVLKVDGLDLSVISIYDLYWYSMTKPHTGSFYLLGYDDDLFVYSLGISPGVTFESSFELIYDEKHGTTPTVRCSVDYALI